jgi:hypothetical protein
MRDAKDDGDAIRMPGNEMNAATAGESSHPPQVCGPRR